MTCLNQWDIIINDGALGGTERLDVPGGWLYRTRVSCKGETTALALCFVPDIKTLKEFPTIPPYKHGMENWG